jgi:hypothetical protein
VSAAVCEVSSPAAMDVGGRVVVVAASSVVMMG